MSSTGTGRETLSKEIDARYQAQEFDEVVRLLRDLESLRELSPTELVLKGRSIQLASESIQEELSEAERAFSLAIERDAQYLPALLELGWYYFAVEEDLERAAGLFRRARQISTEALREATDGLSKCFPGSANG